MINTSRLLSRSFQQQDFTSLFEYLSNPLVYRFEPGGPGSLEQAKELTIERAKGTDFWAVILKSTQKMAGDEKGVFERMSFFGQRLRALLCGRILLSMRF